MRFLAISALLVLAGCPSKKDHDRNMEAALVKMNDFATRMCECKDKACADHVQEAMTAWGTEMAKDASARDPKPNEAQMKKMTDVMVKYTECFTKLMMVDAPIQPTPIEPLPPLNSREVDALIGSAREWARTQHPKLSLANVVISYVDAWGMLDEDHGRLMVHFDHPRVVDDPKRKTGAPVAPPSPHDDCVVLTWNARGWASNKSGCADVLGGGIRCSVKTIWARSIAMGDPRDALATIESRVSSNGREWHFRIEDEPRNVHVAHVFPDDCPLAVEK